MKRKLLSVLLASVLLLSAVSCGKKDPGDASAGQPDQSEPAVSALAPVDTQEPEPTPEDEEPALPYQNPLTGAGTETDLSRNRPVAIMLNNLKKALPQLGVSKADVIYEIPAEGGITRMMALFQDVDGVGNLGSVRSARDYYVSIARGHDAIYLHAGGSPQAYTAITKLGVTSLDCVNGPYEGTLYWRDAARRKNAGLEHSVLTSGEKIQELFPTYKNLRAEHQDGFAVGWDFASEDTLAGFEQAYQLTVPFSTYKTGVFTYDEDSKLYMVEEYGAPYLDGNTGEQVGVKNVLVLYTDISLIPKDKAGRLTVRTTGTGKGLVLWEGRLYHISWSRPTESGCFSFYQENGQPLRLSIGSNYINIVASNTNVTWA